MKSSPNPIRRFETLIRGSVATSLFRRGWLAREPRAALLIVHGLGEHSGRYEHVGAWLARRGFAVHAYDHLGHGRSSGSRGHVRRFGSFEEDLEAVIASVRSEHPDLPLLLLGHSMGGLIAAALARRAPPEVGACALSGAALRVPPLPGTRRWLLRMLRRAAPRLRLDAGIDVAGLSTDPRVGEAYLADPLVERKVTASLAAELLDAIERTAPGGADVAMPLLAMHGADDPICLAEGSERFASAAPQGRFVSYPKMRHEILNEPGWEGVLGDLEAWVDACLSAAGRTAAGGTADRTGRSA